MKKTQAIKIALENSAICGSHRHQVFEEELRKAGYRIVKVVKVPCFARQGNY